MNLFSNKDQRCGCGGNLREIDSVGPSSTSKCGDCGEVYLLLGNTRSYDQVKILLRDWGDRRGDGMGLRPLDDLSAAKRLEKCLLMNLEPSKRLRADFGIQSKAHYKALQDCYVTPYELDRVLGDGQAITELVRAANIETEHTPTFETPYDRFYVWEEKVALEANPGISSNRPTNYDADQVVDQDIHESLACIEEMERSKVTPARVDTVVATKQDKDRGRDR